MKDRRSLGSNETAALGLLLLGSSMFSIGLVVLIASFQ